MLIYESSLIGTPILSMQAAAPIAQVSGAIVDPNGLKIIAFRVTGPVVNHSANLLAASSIREHSSLGMVIDSADEFIGSSDVVHIDKVVSLNFDLLSLKVESKKGTKLGHIIDYTVTSEDYTVQQLIVRRPALKALMDPELTIPRSEIIEVTDYKVIVRDEEKTIRSRAEHEDFIPNFVNPFRKTELTSPAKTEDNS